MRIGHPPTPVPSYRIMMAFIDGENLVFSYQKLLEEGYIPKDQVEHLEDVYVWCPGSIGLYVGNEIIYAGYYTYATGSDNQIEDIKRKINQMIHQKDSYSRLPDRLKPVVLKKLKREKQSKAVDIQMTVDILSNVYQDNLDTVYLMAGDGDYLPIIQEAHRRGKQVYISAFSKGLNPKLEYESDFFFNLDDIYFQAKT